MSVSGLLDSYIYDNTTSLSYSFSDSDSDGGDNIKIYAWEKNGGFLIYLVVMFYVFYGFEIICDEFLVPALNLFCEKLGMADDFAGATLMGLGCCAPDVFSGIFGVLVLHTDVGAGTIVGSLLFNHLAILGGVCLAVQPFKIKLSSFIREVTFYAISLGLLLWSLWDHKISVFESTLFLVTYIIFCIVCGFTPRITRFVEKLRWKCTKKRRRKGVVMDGSYKTLDEDNSSNNNSEDGSNQSNGDIPMDTVPRDFSTKKSSSNSNNNNNNNDEEEEEEETTDSWDEEDETTESGSNSGNTSSDSSTTGLTSVNIAEGEGGISGYLHKKSKWHSKAKVHRLKWRRKWYTLSGEAFYSCKDPLFPDVGHHDIPLADVRTVEVGCDDASPRVFVVKMAGSKKYTFRAQSKEAAAEWAARIREAAAAVAARRANEIPSLSESSGVTPALTPVETEDEGHSMWEMPSDKLWRKVMWALALPFYALFTITIPNVKKKRFENWFVVSFIVCLAWIAGLSYGMVWCGERFAHVLGIPEDIMGLTITAIGASLPSFFGSVIAAREGSFHMAVSNTFGANLSSILVALGLPCFIQTVFVNSGEPFAMESDSIVITVIVLVVGLLVFLASIFITRLWLNKPLGILYFALYFILLGTVVVFQMLGIYF